LVSLSRRSVYTIQSIEVTIDSRIVGRLAAVVVLMLLVWGGESIVVDVDANIVQVLFKVEIVVYIVVALHRGTTAVR